MSQFIVEKNWVKIRENYVVLLLHFLKKWLKKFSERTRENVGVLQFLAVETSISRYIEFFFDFLREKVREIVTVLHFLVVDNFNLKKIVEKLMAKNY